MPFKKGQSGNIKGKPAGTPNKKTQELRDIIRVFITDTSNDLDLIKEKLTIQERLDLLIKLLPYAIGKIESIPAETTQNNESNEVIIE